MSLQVFGFDGQREVRYALPELSAGIDDALKPLHFRYFQAVEGVLTLPAGFEPKGLAVIVEATGPRDIIIREEFPWKLQQQFINLGE